MQSRRTHQASKQRRRGFTLIELLVVISIIATLMSLILPAIQNAREAGRRTQCLNNIRNVTVAALNFASSNKSRLPALAYYVDNPATTTADNMGQRSWVVELLPYMDQQGTYDRWNKTVAWNDNSTATPTGDTNRSLADDLYIEALACPNDESAYQVNGGLSYVANAGYSDRVSASGGEHSFTSAAFDWNADGTLNQAADEDITQDTGVFWPQFFTASQTKNASASIGKIYDGSANTLMFGENINAGSVNWANPTFTACAFVFPLTGGAASGAAAVPVTTPSTTVDNAAMYDPTGAVLANTTPYINQTKAGPEGAPHLASSHPGIVVVSFCDGSAKTLSENMDKVVYTRLITPSGTRQRTMAGATWAPESPVSSTDF